MSAPYPQAVGPGGASVAPTPTVAIDASGAIANTGVTLCSNVTLAAGSGGTAASPTPGSASTPVGGLAARIYATLRAAGTFNTGAALQIESQAVDGVWEPVDAALTARGVSQNNYQLADNSTLRVRNTGTGSVTGLTVTLG